MTEEQVWYVLDSERYIEAVKKMMAIYLNGFDINKIDKRIKNKLEELTNKYDSIQNPVQIRKINSSNRRRNRWMI